MFAFQVEREERGDDDEGYLDPFVEEGATTSSSSPPSAPEGGGSNSDSGRADEQRGQGRSRLLIAAKKF